MKSNVVIGRLRVMFANISLDKLEPDLVIMDEFQRFRFLLNAKADTETGMLAARFFNSDKVRMLLLSATPYKMYTTLEEFDETLKDEHFREFLDVMRFLNVNEEDYTKFRTVWDNYSVRLKELSIGELTVIQAKQAAEDAMYENVCRTERISSSENADMIDDSDVHRPLHITGADILSYVQAQEMMDSLEKPYPLPIDFVKSAPYLMSFMWDYQLKKHIEKYFSYHPDQLRAADQPTLWLRRDMMDQYEQIPDNNARLTRIMEHVFKENAENLLWVPPARPYYELQGAFAGAEHFSKTLIFSSWEMVPRMLSGLISYEAERRTVGKMKNPNPERGVHYFTSDEKRYPPKRLQFKKDKSTGRIGGMALFCFLYPSGYLTGVYDPVDCMNRHLTLREIQGEIREKIRGKLEPLGEGQSRNADQRWYYMAPLLMDDPEYVKAWIRAYSEVDEEDEEDDEANDGSRQKTGTRQKTFRAVMKQLGELYEKCVRDVFGSRVADITDVLGRRPADLLDVLTDMAIAGPAVSVNRTYRDYAASGHSWNSTLPSRIARAFINRMDSVEATSIIALAKGSDSDEAQWRSLLSYCRDGNFQAMFDEYAHLISNGVDKSANPVEQIHIQILSAMNIRTTQYKVDTYQNFCSRMKGKDEKTGKVVNMRTNFAVAFTKGVNRDKDTNRKKTIRNAFNSPFRPFVLASTSIGQEGLDFHNYCRRIVHWNLPSNPIDLEQREGRINRFECLAIRQNVAERYGRIPFKKNIWKEMFEEALRVEKTDGCSELIPYWGMKEIEGKPLINIFRLNNGPESSCKYHEYSDICCSCFYINYSDIIMGIFCMLQENVRI